MEIAQGPVSTDRAVTPDGERVIVPTSIYAPGTLVDGTPHADDSAAGPAAGNPPPAGYSQPPTPSGMPGPDPAYAESAAAYPGAAHRPASPSDLGPGEHPYGDYAYVIREEEAPASRPAQPPVTQPPPQEPPRPEPSAFISRDPSMPAPGDPSAESATAYGPDDPAYGPPNLDWYTSEDQAQEQPAEELQHVRGVFEPPSNQGESGQVLAAGLKTAGADDGAPPLEQIRDVYLTAEAISAENLDRRFDELLERQRKLISEFFTEAALQENAR